MIGWLIAMAALSHVSLQINRSHAIAESKVGPYEIGPGITAPKIIHKVEPEYSGEARRARVQGIVLYRIVVGENGRAADIDVLSPIGFGLDEMGETAILKWRFKPGTKDDEPVAVRATVEVDFRLMRRFYDEKAERRRLAFNVALGNFHSEAPERIQRGLQDLRALASESYAPALGLLGRMMFYGDKIPRDPLPGFALLQKAADQNYGPALYQIGLASVKGDPLPKDTERGLQLMRDAATLGSPQAQFYLAVRYEKGDSVSQDVPRARRYYRLCATAGIDLCQLHIGILVGDQDPIQSLAWLHLAGDQGLLEASHLADMLQARFTPEQVRKAARLEAQLVRKQ